MSSVGQLAKAFGVNCQFGWVPVVGPCRGEWSPLPLSPFGRDGRVGAGEGKGVGLGEGEGEESLRAVGACGCYNPSPQSSPLIQGERRGVAGGVGSHAAPTELGLILDEIL